MTTTAQIQANRKNATHSSGPTSPSGKATCAQNSLKHGLSTSQLIIPGESEEEFNTLLTSLLTTHQPANITETMLVQDMAKHHWLADRALTLQSNAIALSLDGAPPTLALLIRYHTVNERAYHRALAALNASRKTRLAEIGSASKSEKQAAAAEAADAKRDADEHFAAVVRSCQPPTEAEMNAAGWFMSSETGDWEQKNPA